MERLEPYEHGSMGVNLIYEVGKEDVDYRIERPRHGYNRMRFLRDFSITVQIEYPEHKKEGV